MDLILMVMIIQTVIFTITLIILIIQVREQAKATRLEVYSKCQADYSSLTRMLIQQGELRTIYDDLAKNGTKVWKKWKDYSDREKSLYNYFELIYELFERVFLLWKKRWIDAETWKEWDAWLTEVCKHPIFADVHLNNAHMFESAFQKYVNDKLRKLSQRRITADKKASTPMGLGLASLGSLGLRIWTSQGTGST